MTANQFENARRSLGLSIRELAKRFGTSHSTVWRYEHGWTIPGWVVYAFEGLRREIR